MSKPRLPRTLEQSLPRELVHQIYSYVPPEPKRLPPSPSLQAALERLQRSPKRTAMQFYGLEDFILGE
jgi:hypothetical protein